MEFVQGAKLSDVWRDLGEHEIESVLRQLALLESKMISIAFPAEGSLYYARDLEKVAGGGGDRARGCAFLRWAIYKLASMIRQEPQLDVDRGMRTPLSTFLLITPLN